MKKNTAIKRLKTTKREKPEGEESRKKRKKRIKELLSFSLAESKSKAPYPEVIEPWDTNSAYPEFLIYFKYMPNACRQQYIGPKMENISRGKGEK